MFRSISKRLGVLALVAAGLALPAQALGAEATSSGTVSPGSLSLSTSAAPTFSVTLDGTDKTSTYTVPLSVTDATGSGSGWNATITSTQFTTGGGTPRTLSTSASAVTGVTSTCEDGVTCTNPTNAISYPLTVPAGPTAPAAVKLFNAAADTGMGSFTVTPTVQVSVPANAYAGTYSSTLTLASVSGP